MCPILVHLRQPSLSMKLVRNCLITNTQIRAQKSHKLNGTTTRCFIFDQPNFWYCTLLAVNTIASCMHNPP